MLKLSIIAIKSKATTNLVEQLNSNEYEQINIFYDYVEFINKINSNPDDILLFIIEKSNTHTTKCLDFIHINSSKIPYIFCLNNGKKTVSVKLSKYKPINIIHQPFTIQQLTHMLQVSSINQASVNPLSKELPPLNEPNPIELIGVNSPTVSRNNYAFFKSGIEIIKIYFEEIMYVQSDHVYVYLITKSKKIPLRTKLEDVEHYLPALNFQRIHQRYVVNIDHLTKVTAEAVFIENIELPLSKKYKKTLLKHMNIFS